MAKILQEHKIMTVITKSTTLDQWTKAVGDGIKLKYLSVCTGAKKNTDDNDTMHDVFFLAPVHTDKYFNLIPSPTAFFHWSNVVLFVITVIILCSCNIFAILNVPTPSILDATIGQQVYDSLEFRKVNVLVSSTFFLDDKVERFGFNKTSA
jgi:hypothetical protein